MRLSQKDEKTTTAKPSLAYSIPNASHSFILGALSVLLYTKIRKFVIEPSENWTLSKSATSFFYKKNSWKRRQTLGVLWHHHMSLGLKGVTFIKANKNKSELTFLNLEWAHHCKVHARISKMVTARHNRIARLDS